MVGCWVTLLLFVLFTKVFVLSREVIKLVTMEEVGLVFKREANLPFLIMENLLMVVGEVVIGLRPATLPPITQVGLVDFRVALLLLVLFTKLFMVMREVIKVVTM